VISWVSLPWGRLLRGTVELVCQFVKIGIWALLYGLFQFRAVYLSFSFSKDFCSGVAVFEFLFPLVICFWGDSKHCFQFLERVSCFSVGDCATDRIYALHSAFLGFTSLILILIDYTLKRFLKVYILKPIDLFNNIFNSKINIWIKEHNQMKCKLWYLLLIQ
jgi:hypothetical protein